MGHGTVRFLPPQRKSLPGNVNPEGETLRALARRGWQQQQLSSTKGSVRMPGRLLLLVCCIFVCNLVRLHRRLAVVMAVEDVPPSTSLLGSSGDQHHHHEEEQQQCKRCILQDDRSFRSLRDHKTRPLCLTSTSLEYYAASGKEDSAPLILSLADVVGAKAGPAPASGGGQRAGGGINGRGGIVHQLQVFAYVASGEGKEMGCTGRGGPCRKNKRRATHQTWLASDPDTAQHWATEINNRLRQSQGREEDLERGNRGPGRRLLVLVNPVSGTGESRSTWEKTLRPMLEQAMTTANVVFSTRRGELAEIITNAGDNSSTDATRGASAGGGGGGSTVGSLDDLDGIVVVGGDGTFFEVLQGMYARPDCARQLSRLSLGIVPAGSGNGLAKTVSVESGEWFGAVSASFLAAKGQTKAMDLLLTESADKKYLAFLNVGWGMISDVDIESEAYRWMGSLRFTVGTIVRIANLKHYRGRISFLPDLDAAAATTPTPSNASASAPFRMPPLSEPVHQDGAGSESAAAGAPALEGWTSVEGEFILADMTQASHIAHDMPMAPHSRIGDGLIDLFFIKKGASRFAMIQMFLAMEKGGHISPRFPCISWHRVRAFRIEPLTSSGRITVDGELVDYAPLQQHVWRKAAHVFCSPDDDAERLPACLGS